jgi:hypothetical protein
MRIIKVEWIDSTASNQNWLMKADIDNWDDVEPLSIFTYGALVQEDKNYIVVAQNYGFDPEQCCNLMSIPKGCIKEIKTIEELLKPTEK